MLSLRKLYTSWKTSQSWNDLKALPKIQAANDEWPNNPVLARKTLTRRLDGLEVGAWYSIASLIRSIYEQDPAFQRPGGDFYSWYLYDDEASPLDGIEHWFSIEGALLRYLLKGPLRWFGAIRFGGEKHGGASTSFSLTRLYRLLEDPETQIPPIAEAENAALRADGQMSVPRLAPRATRYQLARFLDPLRYEGHTYHYRLSARALKEARRQGLQLDQVQSVFKQACDADLPPSILKAIENFEQKGYQATLVDQRLLKVSDAELMSILVSTQSTNKFILELLNPTTAVVSSLEWERFTQAATRLGILLDSPDTGGQGEKQKKP
jgi:hypothetical protein